MGYRNYLYIKIWRITSKCMTLQLKIHSWLNSYIWTWRMAQIKHLLSQCFFLYYSSRKWHICDLRILIKILYSLNTNITEEIKEHLICRCGPCQRIAPVFADMAGRFPNAVFLKIDVNQCSGAAASQGVSATPTFIFYRNKVGSLLFYF